MLQGGTCVRASRKTTAVFPETAKDNKYRPHDETSKKSV
jgi:hypothetical protein